MPTDARGNRRRPQRRPTPKLTGRPSLQATFQTVALAGGVTEEMRNIRTKETSTEDMSPLRIDLFSSGILSP